MLPPPLLTSEGAAMPAKHLWILMGPSGAGKSRIGKHLRDTLGLTFIEGDDYLTPEDKHRLATTPAPHPSLASLITSAVTTALHHPTPGVAVACSALRLADRHAWRCAVQAANNDPPSCSLQHPTTPEHLLGHPPPQPAHIHLHFLYLQISESLARRTVAVRQARDAHFMPPAAVRGQFAVLEPPGLGERDCVVLFSEETAELKGMAGGHVGGVMGVVVGEERDVR